MTASGNQPYLSTFVPAPDQLTDFFDHLEREIAARTQSPYRPGQRRAVLLQGVATPPIFSRFVIDVLPAHPDATGVERTVDGFAQHLNTLLSPNDHGVVANTTSAGSAIINADRIETKLDAADISRIRRWQQDYLEIDDSLDIAERLDTLNEVAPLVVDALLELQLPDAERLYDEAVHAASSGAVHRTLWEARPLFEMMHKVAIAYTLRQVFMQAAGRLHAPTGWNMLDEMRRLQSGGSLRVHDLTKRLQLERKRVEMAIHLFKKSQRGTNGVLSNPTACVSVNDNIPHLYHRLGIVPRARVQLALWRVEHGDQLDTILADVISEIRQRLIVMWRELKAFKKRYQPNSVVGNLSGPSLQVQAYLAVREAVAWVAAVSDEGGTITSDSRISLAVKERDGGEKQIAAIDAQKITANDEFTDRLFWGLRVAFLQDDEALPPSLQVADPASPSKKKVRTHDRAAQIIGRHYSLEEQLDALENAWGHKVKKLPKDAARWQQLLATRLDFEIKREAKRLLRDPDGAEIRQALAGRDAIRNLVMGNLKAA